MNPTFDLERIYELIATDELNDALKLLREITTEHAFLQQEKAELLVLSNRFNQFSRNERMFGSANQADYNQLVHALIDFSEDVFIKLEQAPLADAQHASTTASTREFLLEMPLQEIFVGRQRELEILDEKVRSGKQIILIKGIGGLGKTSLASAYVESRKESYEIVHWKTFLNPLPLNDLVDSLSRMVGSQHSPIRQSDQPFSPTKLLTDLLHQYKVLLILDNFEQIIDAPEHFPDYEKFLTHYARSASESRIIITSRISNDQLDRSLVKGSRYAIVEIGGINEEDAITLFKRLNIHSASTKDWQKLVALYHGNPLAIELAAKYIENIHFSDVAEFLSSEPTLFDEFVELLDWHANQLNPEEREIVLWLAIERVPVSLLELKQNFISLQSKRRLGTNLNNLLNKLPIERVNSRFSLQPVLVEYFTEKLIENAVVDFEQGNSLSRLNARFINILFNEIAVSKPEVLGNFSLIKSYSDDHVIAAQRKVIIEPLVERLIDRYGSLAGLRQEIQRILDSSRSDKQRMPTYLVGNIINILVRHAQDISKYDFSGLYISQGYFQGEALRNVNFQQAHFSRCIFTSTFGSILDIKLFPDQRSIAGGTTSYEIKIWDCQSLQEKYSLTVSTWVWTVAVHPDKPIVIGGTDDRKIFVWHYEEGESYVIHEMDEVRSILFSPDGKSILSGNESYSISRFDLETRERIAELKGGHNGWIASIVTGPNQTLFSGSSDGKLAKWTLSDNQLTGSISTQQEGIACLAYWEANNVLLVGGNDGTIQFRNQDLAEQGPAIQAHGSAVTSMIITEYGIISGGADGYVKLWDKQQRVLKTIVRIESDAINALAYVANSHSLFSASDKQDLSVTDLTNNTRKKSLLAYSNAIWRSIYLNSNEKIIVSDDYSLSVWQKTAAGFQLQRELKGHDKRVKCLAAGRLNPWMFSGSQDLKVIWWHTDDFTILKTLSRHKDEVCGIALNPAEDKLYSVGKDGLLVELDLRSGKDRTVTSFDDELRTLACSQDLVVTAGEKGVVYFVDAQAKSLDVQEHRAAVRAMCIHDNLLLTASEDSDVGIWQLDTGKLTSRFTAHDHQTKAVAYSPRLRWVASGSDDGIIYLWSIDDKKIVHRFQAKDAVKCLQFSPDETELLCSLENGSFLVLATKDATLLESLVPPRPYEGMNVVQATGLGSDQLRRIEQLGGIID